MALSCKRGSSATLVWNIKAKVAEESAIGAHFICLACLAQRAHCTHHAAQARSDSGNPAFTTLHFTKWKEALGDGIRNTSAVYELLFQANSHSGDATRLIFRAL